MRINREKDYINRLVDILDYKQVTYQTKLEEIYRKKEIEEILGKYPSNPIRGLVELDNSQLITLLSYFTIEEYSESDIDIKKYWIIEADNNEALKETSRYKESIKLFERLGDKLQEFLESIKGINVIEEDTEKLLKLVESLQDAINNDKPIYDLSMYYPILSPSETLVEEDIYNFLIALSLYNLKNMANKDEEQSRIKLTKEMKTYLASLLDERIEELQQDKVKCVIINEKLVNLSNLIDKLEEDNDSLLEVYPNEIESVMKSLWDQSIIDSNIEKLSIPLTVIKGKQQGLKIDFDTEEKNIIDEFIKTLKKEEARISEKEINDKKEREDRIVEEIESLQATLDKLNEKREILYNINDFDNILELVKKKDKDFDFTKNVIVVLNALNFKYNGSIPVEIPESVEEELIEESKVEPTDEEKKIEEEPEIDEEESEIQEIEKPVVSKQTADDLSIDISEMYKEESTSATVEKLFFDHGFNFTDYPSRLVKKIVNNIPIEKLEEMIEYLDSKEELAFIKEYTYSYAGVDGIARRIHDIKCSQLYYLLVYSTPAIFDSLLSISRENEIPIKDICAVPRVFASRDADSYGTYENFVNNVRFLKEYYPNALMKFVKRAPYVLGTDSYLLRTNIEIIENYGMSIEEDKRGAFPSPRALMTRNLEYVVDRYIEAQEYDYIERFRNQIETNAAIALRLKYKQLKGLDFRKNEFYNFNHNFEHLKPFLKGLSIENIAVGINDSAIKWLDSINEEEDKDKARVQYVIKGIYISRKKVLKYYSTLLINGYDDKADALFYSIVKDSFITRDEYDTLKAVVEEGGR